MASCGILAAMTPPRLLTVLVLASIVLEGCAYPSAMGRGKRAGRDGDWSGAYDHYTRAVNIKETPEALAQRDNARIKAMEQANQDIKDAFAQTNVKKAFKAWRVVESLATPEEKDYSKNDLSDSLLAEVQNRIDANDPDAAYELALAANKEFPGELFAEAALDKARFYYRGRAESFEADGRFLEADAMLQALIDKEPERAHTVALQRGRVWNAWADALIAQGEELAARDLRGMAAVKLAKAYELVDSKEEALAKAKELAKENTWRSALRVHVVYGDTGSLRRRKAFKEAMTELLGEIENAQITTKENARLILDTDVGEANCRETSEVEKVNHEFVSGQIDVPNEAYVAIQTKLKEWVAVQKKHKARMDELEPGYKTANSELRRLQDELDIATATDERAGKELKRAQDTLARQRERLDQLTTQIDTVTDPEKVDYLTNAIMMIGKNVAEWEYAVQKWSTALNDTGSVLRDKVQQQLKRRAEVEKIVAEYEAEKVEYDKATSQVRALNSEASLIPQTVTKDVMDNFAYDKTTWTRTCKAPLYATNWTAWESAIDKQQRLQGEKKEVDISHPGHEASFLDEDRKDYINSEEDLIEEADKENAKVVLEWVKKLAQEYYNQRVEEAKALIATEGKETVATEEVASLLIGSPEFLDDATKAAFSAFLKKNHGLEDYTLMAEGSGDSGDAPDLPDDLY